MKITNKIIRFLDFQKPFTPDRFCSEEQYLDTRIVIFTFHFILYDIIIQIK